MNTAHPTLVRLHPSSGPDLDSRILVAEHAVLVRDQRLRHEAGSFGHLLRERTRHSARIAAVAAVVPFLLGWMMARDRRRPRGDDDDVSRYERARLSDAPWAGIVPLVWPLLPERLRSRMSPGLASFLTGIGLPLLARRAAKRAEKKRAATAAAASGNDAGTTLHILN